MAQFAERTRALPMHRICGALTGVLFVAFSLALAGCGSSKPMRFQFKVPTGQAQIEIDEGSVYRGNTGEVYTLKSNDAEKTIELTWNGKTVYGKMDVFDHTALTRISVVPVHLTNDIITAVDDFKAVTYVVYQRYRDANVRAATFTSALTPVLEKVAAEYADKGVILAKLNVDEEQFIAAQFQVRSIPTVYAIFQGQPVADLTPARTESQLKQMLDQLLDKLPIEAGSGGQQADITQLVAMGEQVLAEGDGERAASIFAQIADMAPEDAAVQAGLIRALVAASRPDEARAALEAVPDTLRNDPLIAQATTALDLAGSGVDDGELQTLRAAAAERPTDMEAQFAFAQAAFAVGQRDDAADTLLAMIEREPEWNEGAAKAKLLQIFEATGLEDAWVAAQRRRLSLLLFG